MLQEFTRLLPYKQMPSAPQPPPPVHAGPASPEAVSPDAVSPPSEDAAPLAQEPSPPAAPAPDAVKHATARKRVKPRAIRHIGPDSKAFMGLKAHSKHMHAIWPLGKRRYAKK